MTLFGVAPATVLEVVVYHEPTPQGSKIPAVTRDGKPYLRDDNANELRAWRRAVAATLTPAKPPEPLDGPLQARIIYTMPPSSDRHRPWPHTRPDLDKLLRATLDALQLAGAIVNDARIVEISRLAKVFPGRDPEALDRPGARITITTLTG